MDIVDFFYLIARENLRIKSFRYARMAAKGAGSDNYPMIWLDDPINGGNAREGNLGTLQWTANVDILGIPADDDDVVNVQRAALLTGLGIPERAKVIYRTTGITITGFNFTSLRKYYDDNAAGYRFTYTITQASPVDLCANDYDPNKVFTTTSPLPAFATDGAGGCVAFSDHAGLPNFSVEP